MPLRRLPPAREGGQSPAAGDVDQVGDDGSTQSALARAAPLEYRGPDGIAFNHRVVDVVDGRSAASSTMQG